MAVAPINDSIANAIDTTTLPEFNQFYMDLTQATTVSSDPTCGAPVYQTLWYKYTSSVDQFMDVALREGTGVRPRLSAWSGAPGALTLAQCDPNGHEVEFQAVAGQTYYFEVASPEPAGVSTLYLYVYPYGAGNTAIPPANDLFWYAPTIASIPATFSDAVGYAAGDYSYDPISSGNSVWYQFTPSTSEQLDAVYDTTSGIYQFVTVITGSLDAPVIVATNDGYTASSTTDDGKLRFQAVAGTPYYLMFSQANSTEFSSLSTMELKPSPAPVGGTLTIESAKIKSRKFDISKNGAYVDTDIAISFNLTCDTPIASVNIYAKVTQNGYSAYNFAGTASCAGGSGSGTVVASVSAVVGHLGGIQSGDALITVTASDFDTNFGATAGPETVSISAH